MILFLVKLQSGKKYQKILLALKTPIYSKGESKQLFKLYLGKLEFSKEDIRDEVEFYTEGMKDDEESIKEDISYAKEELKNATTKLKSFPEK